MNNEERKAFYEAEGKFYRPQAIEEFGDFCIKYPYKQDMPRYQFATAHLLAMNLQRFHHSPMNQHRRLKVLDIGCQNGAFDVGWANLGADVTAIDISDDYLEITANSLKKFSWHTDWRVLKADIVNDADKLEQYGPFDMIMALEVVEHLPDLVKFMQAINHLACQRDAKVIINVPGGDSWKDDPGHLLSFWDSHQKIITDHRRPVIIPECFGSRWSLSEFEKHSFNDREYWYAVCLER